MDNNMKTFDEILVLFLPSVKIKTKENTYRSYVGKTKVFSDWLALSGLSNLPLAQIDDQIIERFSVYLAETKKLDRTTCVKYQSTLSHIFKYAMTRGECTHAPFDLFVLPQKKKDFGAQVIEKDHMKSLLTSIKTKDMQLYVACLTQYYCFTRPGKELRLLKVKDIDTINWTLRVDADCAKNGHKRIVTIPASLIEILKQYGIESGNKEMYVFGNNKRIGATPCSVNMLRYRFDKHRDKLNLPKEYKFYSMKHSGATSLHNSNHVSLRGIMDQLGHLSLSATQHYIKRHTGIYDSQIRDNFPNPY
jgi:site-specific recombinase XerD